MYVDAKSCQFFVLYCAVLTMQDYMLSWMLLFA